MTSESRSSEDFCVVLKAEMTFFCVVVFLHESTMRMISLFLFSFEKRSGLYLKLAKFLKRSDRIKIQTLTMINPFHFT